jgi:hypothetical protein
MSIASEMRGLVSILCSEPCAGRATGTPEGRAARAAVARALGEAGLDPRTQPIQEGRGANVLALVPGEIERWVVLGAHYDHLGRRGREVFWGAEDNAASVAILAAIARALAAAPPAGRGVVVAAFDAEEPPHFMTEDMGSEAFARAPPVPLERVDLMISMDLLGRALGPQGAPEEVRRSIFALGAERSEGTADCVDGLARAVPGVIVRRADAEVIPPLSDYWAFWRRGVPFLFLSNGRGRTYHTPEDRPEGLDFGKLEATARWVERFVRTVCARPERRIEFRRNARDDASTLRSLAELASALAPYSAEARWALSAARALLFSCGRDGRLPDERVSEVQMLARALEGGLA